MEQLFRKDYAGEHVVFNTTQVKGVAEKHIEFVPNTIIQEHTGYAAVFGNGRSRANLNFELFRHHRGGLHATKKLTTYGCNAMFRDCDPHVLVVRHPMIADEVAKTNYSDDNIVISTVKNVLKHPDKFHLIPHDPSFTAGATALYLAAFDGHRKVYFLGFDGQDTPGVNNNIYAGTPGYPTATSDVDYPRWIREAMTVFTTYYNTEFIRVVPYGGEVMPEEWKYAPNLRQINMTQFISEVDLGST